MIPTHPNFTCSIKKFLHSTEPQESGKGLNSRKFHRGRQLCGWASSVSRIRQAGEEGRAPGLRKGMQGAGSGTGVGSGGGGRLPGWAESGVLNTEAFGDLFEKRPQDATGVSMPYFLFLFLFV